MLLLLASWSARRLTITPMLHDEIAIHSHHTVRYSVNNGDEAYQEYMYWVDLAEHEERVLKGEFGVAGKTTHQLNVAITDIKPDKMMVYRVCVQEKPKRGVQVALRNCAKLRLYWPRSILSPE